MNAVNFYLLGLKDTLKNLRFRIAWSNNTPENIPLNNIRFDMDYFKGSAGTTSYYSRFIFNTNDGTLSLKYPDNIILNEFSGTFNKGFIDFTVEQTNIPIDTYLSSISISLNSASYQPSNAVPLKDVAMTGSLQGFTSHIQHFLWIPETNKQVRFIIHYPFEMVKLNNLPEIIDINLSYRTRESYATLYEKQYQEQPPYVFGFHYGSFHQLATIATSVEHSTGINSNRIKINRLSGQAVFHEQYKIAPYSATLHTSYLGVYLQKDGESKWYELADVSVDMSIVNNEQGYPLHISVDIPELTLNIDPSYEIESFQLVSKGAYVMDYSSSDEVLSLSYQPITLVWERI